MIDLICDSAICLRNHGYHQSVAKKIIKETVTAANFKIGTKCKDCGSILFPKRVRTHAGGNRRENFKTLDKKISERHY